MPGKRRGLPALALLILAVVAFSPGISQAQGTSRTFPETGKTVSGPFLDYWKTHGGLAQQGYPISAIMQEVSDTDGKTYTVQYFERAVFEAHPELAPANTVLLSLLGMFRYSRKYLGAGGAPNQSASNEPEARLFRETGKTVGGLFLRYWIEHGGLAQQGYPISNEFTEVSDLDGKLYTVQYFQRAVFEYHPENAAPYNVLISQLGTFRYRQKYDGGVGSTPVSALTPPAPSGSVTSITAPPATVTLVAPTSTDTNTPHPSKTPVSTACPALNIRLTCRIGGQGDAADVSWEVTDGSGDISGVLRIEGGGRIVTSPVSGRSGHSVFYPPCDIGQRVTVSSSIELHDQCDQLASSSCEVTVISAPCP